AKPCAGPASKAPASKPADNIRVALCGKVGAGHGKGRPGCLRWLSLDMVGWAGVEEIVLYR
ncbi:MAG: hypothetical protein ACO1N5_04690, partial [Noviherbaspirillum sp.]